MSATHLKILLQQVARNRDVGPLFRLGLHPVQVVQLVAEAIDEGLIIRTEAGSLALSDAGYERIVLLKATSTRFVPKPLDHYRRTPLDMAQPFLPARAPRGIDHGRGGGG